jgi:membrane AbrB-like protein
VSGLSAAAVSLLAGAAGGLLARRLRAPGGAILGALLATAAVHLALTELPPLGSGFRTAAQILMGAVLGTTLTRSPLRVLREVVWPVIGALSILIASALAAGAALVAVSSLSTSTALFSTAPGGASDMAAAALQLGGDVPLIAAFHVVRQVLVFVVLVAVFSHVLGGGSNPGAPRR